MRSKLLALLPLVLIGVLLPAGCSRGAATGGVGSWTTSPGPVRRDAAVRTETEAGGLLREDCFVEILVLDFADGASLPNFRTGQEIAAYFVREMEPRFPGQVSRWSGSREEASGRDRAVIVSGQAALGRQVRKALSSERPPADGPFRTAGREIVARVVYTLTLSLNVTSAGERIFKAEFKENKAYEDLEKPPDFALLELLDRVKNEIFPVLFGVPRHCP